MFSPDTLLVLASAPTGFGHLRVTQALREALPADQPVQILGIHDSSVRLVYDLISRNPLLRAVSDFIQNHRLFEDSYTFVYRRYLAHTSASTYRTFAGLLAGLSHPVSTLLVVATHFSLAHQIAACKSQLERDFHLHLVLVVVVTDDSPQRVWAIPGADFVFVPSLTTKDRLARYFPVSSLSPRIIITPYPLSPSLALPLSPDQRSLRRLQLDPVLDHPVNLIVPVSGAAVQLSYLRDLLSVLVSDPRIHITVVSRSSAYCAPFLSWCARHPAIRILSSPSDDRVVKLYEQAYLDTVFSLEITKPSEQSFKALLSPDLVGGSLLLFSPPVGRQEIDNLAFLRRHHLLSEVPPGRSLILPPRGRQAGLTVLSWLHSGRLLAMSEFTGYLPHPELRPDGAKLFWSALCSLVYS